MNTGQIKEIAKARYQELEAIKNDKFEDYEKRVDAVAEQILMRKELNVPQNGENP